MSVRQAWVAHTTVLRIQYWVNSVGSSTILGVSPFPWPRLCVCVSTYVMNRCVEVYFLLISKYTSVYCKSLFVLLKFVKRMVLFNVLDGDVKSSGWVNLLIQLGSQPRRFCACACTCVRVRLGCVCVGTRSLSLGLGSHDLVLRSFIAVWVSLLRNHAFLPLLEIFLSLNMLWTSSRSIMHKKQVFNVDRAQSAVDLVAGRVLFLSPSVSVMYKYGEWVLSLYVCVCVRLPVPWCVSGDLSWLDPAWGHTRRKLVHLAQLNMKQFRFTYLKYLFFVVVVFVLITNWLFLTNNLEIKIKRNKSTI